MSHPGSVVLEVIGLARQEKCLYLSHLKYSYNNSFPPVANTCNISSVIDSEIWHNRLAHLSTPKVKLLHQLDPLIHLDFQKICDACYLARQKRLFFPVSASTTQACFDLVHVDIWGAMSIHSLYGHFYFLIVFYDFSRSTWVFLMKSKSETRSIQQQFCLYIKTQFSTIITCIKSGQGQDLICPNFYAKQ